MRIVIALGGNALLKENDPLSSEVQRRNLQQAMKELAPIVAKHEVVITHGNGPQVGLLALQSSQTQGLKSDPLDVLGAETEGMIGYLIEQELRHVLPPHKECATLLTQVEVNASDPAFEHPDKPIGPRYSAEEAGPLQGQRGWTMQNLNGRYRRVVASPRPIHILQQNVIEQLLSQQTTVICAGGGGIPVVCDAKGQCHGVEAVIDKDRVSALLAHQLGADHLLMLTDVDAVHESWGEADSRRFRCIAPAALSDYGFADGSMGPKVQAAIDFVEASGGTAGIGPLDKAQALLEGEAGTRVSGDCKEILWW
ncbi:MAG: carbamate kinase [Gammaproteobacteria bacterium]|nr:carbamate kinase [Gammaproteobacteria bacterium]